MRRDLDRGEREAIALAWPVPAETWTWFGALVLGATIAPFAAYLAGLARLPVSVASILAASEVVFGSLIGYVIFGEQLRGWQIVGAGLVVGGVALIALRGNRPAGGG